MSLIHRILHGHWPQWEMWRYDFFTWETVCVACQTMKIKPS